MKVGTLRELLKESDPDWVVEVFFQEKDSGPNGGILNSIEFKSGIKTLLLGCDENVSFDRPTINKEEESA